MQNSIKTRVNLCTELGPPLSIIFCVCFECLATCKNSEAQVFKISDLFKKKNSGNYHYNQFSQVKYFFGCNVILSPC